MKRIIKGPFLDWGEDLNLYIHDDNAKSDGLSSALFTDDAIKSQEIALSETTKRLAPYWINSHPLLVGYVNDKGESFLFFLDESLKKKIIVFEFLDIHTPHTIRGIPYTKEFIKRYHGAGVEFIGIINSRFEFIKIYELINKECHRLGIQFPVVIDHDFAIWRALEGRHRPRRVLMNHEQKIVAEFIGTCCSSELEQEIQSALRHTAPGLPNPRLFKLADARDDISAFKIDLTKEVYFGMKNATPLGNTEVMTPPEEANDTIFHKPQEYKIHAPYLHGPWLPADTSVYVSSNPYNKGLFTEDSSVSIKFIAGSAGAIIGMKNFLTADITTLSRLQILLDGKPVKDTSKGADIKIEEGKKSFVHVHEPRYYELVKNLTTDVPHKIEIIVPSMYADNLEIFALYFYS